MGQKAVSSLAAGGFWRTLRANLVPTWLYIVLCVVVPAVWGVCMVAAFNLIDGRRSKPPAEPTLPPIDYSI